VLAVTPALPGVAVRVVDGGGRLLLSNTGPRDVVVLGYRNEPYLRVGPDGVFQNGRSPSTFSNRSTVAPTQIPASYSADAPPDWRHISSQPVAVFHDHRAHWSGRADPPAVKRAKGTRQIVTPDWQIPIRAGDRTSILSGSIEWVPGPSPWPWAAVAVAIAALVLLISRSPWQTKALAAVTALAVVTDAVHTLAVWTGTTAPLLTQLYGSATSFAGWVIAAIAIHRLLTGKLEAGRTYMLLAAIFLALAGAAPDVPALARSQVPTGLDPLVTRAAISTTLGLGAGMLLAALLSRQLGAPRLAPAGPGRGRPRQGGGRPRAGDGAVAPAAARRPGNGQRSDAGTRNRQGAAGKRPRKPGGR
jgi:hypothetical protein